MSYIRLELEINLDQHKLTEKDFCKVVDKFFKKLARLTKAESSEEKMGFNIVNRYITVDVSIDLKEKFLNIFPKFNSNELIKALDAITKYIKYEKCEKVGSIYINRNNTHKDLFAYQNKLYLSEITLEENQKIQTVRGLKEGEVSFKISNEIEEIPVETNVVLAHMSL
ncbi:hypothetical protein CON18_14765 [Bacillus cereus]|uniref:hypothetical protein n=1 Tax=Bacillus cereus TaxID=1396 RepID=UPI000BECFCD6|nr:hypothetical protein [Bacillus cereus]PDZ39440.1 hypothetical protein CON18_14765 [Bacillus cereus]PGN74815.1 hypothetical protein CN963_28820 [Bacillus cereus]